MGIFDDDEDDEDTVVSPAVRPRNAPTARSTQPRAGFGSFLDTIVSRDSATEEEPAEAWEGLAE